MFGQPIDVNFTSSGHYCVSIRDNGLSENKSEGMEEVLVVEPSYSLKKREIVLKLHKQFGHASADRLISLLQTSGTIGSDTKSIVTDICSKCEVSHQQKRPNAKQIEGFSHANDFNQVVAMDLHEIDHNLYYLHISDVFSRLSAAAVIRRKDPQVIVDKFMQVWVSVYGIEISEIGVYTDTGGNLLHKYFTIWQKIRTCK